MSYPINRQTSQWILWRYAALVFGSCAVGTASLFAYGRREGLGAFTRTFQSYPFIDMWVRWDARWYEMIATQGYSYTPGEQSAVAFFPLYPLLMRAGAALGLPPLVAGILVTVTCGFVGLCLFRAWCLKLTQEHATGIALSLVLLWPFAFFLYGAVYSDALFFMLVVAAFLFLERRQIWLATLFGALATLARPVAPALILGLLVRNVELRLKERRPLSATDLAPLLAASGLAAFMAFLAWNFGAPNAFVETQVGWRQDPGLHVWLKLDFFRSPEFWDKAPRAFLHAALSLACLGMAIPAWRRLGKGYSVYIVAIVGIPFLSSAEFISLGRYALASFPSFLTLALLLENRPWLRRGWLAASAALLVLMLSKFAQGRYVS